MAQKISISELRTRITLQQPTITTGADGAQVAGYADATDTPVVWARWVNDHGAESLNAAAATNVQRATVLVRYRADVLATWQVVLDGSAWKILSVDQVRDGNRWTELRVERALGTV